MDSKPGDKIRLFATIEPFNLKLGLCFNADSLVCIILL